MNTERILETLDVSGLIDRNDNWTIDPVAGGLNSRVYRARRHGEEPALTIRMRRPNDRSAAEVDALTDVSGCPGVPRLQLLTNELLVLDYLPGEPRNLQLLDDRQLATLARRLACIHAIGYSAFTPWPHHAPRTGTRTDLLRFRIESLAGYTSYADAREGRAHPALPDLFQRLSQLDLSVPSWAVAEFSRLHGDLSRGNLLWHGDELGLIDWEYSRIGDPADDLAYLLTEQSIGPDSVIPLRKAYNDAGGDDRCWERTPAYALFNSVDSALWWADYSRTHGSDNRDQIEQRVAAAFQWLNSGSSP